MKPKELTDLLYVLRDVGIPIFISLVAVGLSVKFFLKKMGEAKCVTTDIFKHLSEDIKYIKEEVKSMKTAIDVFLTIFKYKGKDDD